MKKKKICVPLEIVDPEMLNLFKTSARLHGV